MTPTIQTQSGVGLVRIEDREVYGAYRYEFLSERDAAFDAGRPPEGEVWAVRVALNDYFALGLKKFQWVQLQLPLDEEVDVCLKAVWIEPPFVWLEFEREL